MIEEPERTDSDKGKVVPLSPIRQDLKKKENEKGKFIPHEKKSENSNSSDVKSVRYFPREQKEYYRQILLQYKQAEDIGIEKLRDRIMEPEDGAIIKERRAAGFIGPKSDARDSRLTVDDLKKWLSPRATHQLGDSKFVYVERFILQVVPWDLFEEFSDSIIEARRKYHVNALLDMFADARLDMISPWVKGISGIAMVGDFSKDDRTYLLFYLSKFDQGIGHASVFLSSVLPTPRQSRYPSFIADNIDEKALLVLATGYAVPVYGLYHSASHPPKGCLRVNIFLTRRNLPAWKLRLPKANGFEAGSMLSIELNFDVHDTSGIPQEYNADVFEFISGKHDGCLIQLDFSEGTISPLILTDEAEVIFNRLDKGYYYG